MRRILLLQARPEQHYVVHALIPVWLRMGYRVFISCNLQDLPPAEAVFVHVDQSEVSAAYLQAAQQYPIQINGRADNISRARYSQIRLYAGDDYDGPVIVKTLNNYGGLPEYLAQHAVPEAGTRLALGTTAFLDPNNYPIFNRLRDMPAEVWGNPHLSVEKFLPEREGDVFFVRYWTFFGKQEMAGRYGSRHPIVKFSGMVTPDKFAAPPPILRQWREELGLDYGRFDYVMHQGLPILLDVNKTLGGGDSIGSYLPRFHQLATGIRDYLP